MNQTIKVIDRVKAIDRVLLKITIVCLLISCLLTLIFGDNFNLDNDIIPTFIWISIIVGVWMCLLSIVTLLILITIYKLKNKGTWHSFKREIILTLASIGSLTMLWLCGLIVY
jgi:hypothetical protein